MTTYYTLDGDLYHYRTGEYVRPATAEEVAASDAAAERDGGVGAFEADDVVRDYVIEDLTHVYWPGMPAYRSRATAPGRGYRTADEAHARMEYIQNYYARTHGCGMELRVVARSH